MLKARINKLEQRARARAAVGLANDVDDADEETKLAQFRSDLAILFYATWRHEGLTLEQRLALARDDLRLAPGDRHVTRAGREFEIRILLSLDKIDDATAWALRANADQHFGPDSGQPPLLGLPVPIEFDEADALRTARMRCPRVETLTLERQLAMAEEDHLHEVAARAQRPPEHGPYDSADLVSERLYEIRVKASRERIRQRDAHAAAGATTTEP